MQIPKAAHHSSFDIFNRPEVLITFDNSYEQETFPITSDDATLVEFLLNTNRNIYLDLQSLELKIEAKTKNDGNNLTVDATESNITDPSKVAFSNYFLHSFFMSF